jgi:2-hydroxychromene-2-carboxylate isomerase
MPTVRFYYDVVCPFAYLASTRVDAVLEAAGATVEWCPVLLGGIYKHVDGPQDPNAVMSAPKARLNLLDMTRWADHFGVPLNVPGNHPQRSVQAMRLVVGAPKANQKAVSRALFRAYWVEGADINDATVLARIATDNGIDPAVITSREAKQALFDVTAEGAERGLFGVPSFVLDDGTLFWGQDRLDLVAERLGGAVADPPIEAPSRGARLRFFHDFSSPFSYLASTQIDRIAAEHGAAIEKVPFLLGALFREIGTPDVPLMVMNEAKRRYLLRDLHDWAARWSVPFRFPSDFPIRSVAPLRVALQAPQTTDTLYRAAWVDDRRIGDPEVLRAVLDDAGFDGAALVAGTTDPGVKAQLRANTEAAKAAGAFGVPTCEVRDADGGRPVLFWGQDRLRLVERALDGWRPANEAG